MSDNRLPLTVLAGFLGSGKTTWLRHQLRHGLRAHVVVNEAAGVAVDQALLSDADGLTVLSGGCACCDGKAALVAALRILADQRSKGGGAAQVVLETSGLADPAAILQTIATDPVLVHHFRIRGTVVLVDASGFLTGSPVPALALQQMRAADRLILSKTDRVPAQAVADLCASLRRLNPMAALEAAVAGQGVPLPAGPGSPVRLEAADTGPLVAMTLPIPPGADWATVSLWLSALLHGHGEAICRIKGVIRSPAGRLLIQTVRRQVQPPEILPEGAGSDDTLALIGAISDPLAVHRSLARFLGD